MAVASQVSAQEWLDADTPGTIGEGMVAKSFRQIADEVENAKGSRFRAVPG